MYIYHVSSIGTSPFSSLWRSHPHSHLWWVLCCCRTDRSSKAAIKHDAFDLTGRPTDGSDVNLVRFIKPIGRILHWCLLRCFRVEFMHILAFALLFVLLYYILENGGCFVAGVIFDQQSLPSRPCFRRFPVLFSPVIPMTQTQTSSHTTHPPLT